MEISEIVSLSVAFIGWGVAVIKTIVTLVKNKKLNNKNALTAMLKDELIPLMEQAESFLRDSEEKENWVIKKLADKLHIDFYKYKNTLKIVKEIISSICKETKINVNKVVVVEEKISATTQKEEGNGVF